MEPLVCKLTRALALNLLFPGECISKLEPPPFVRELVMPQASQNLLTVKFKDLIYQQRAPSLDEKERRSRSCVRKDQRMIFEY